MQTINEKKSSLGFYLLILTIFLILAEISFLIESSKFYFSDFKLVSNHLTVPMHIVPGVLGFIAAQLSIHFSFMLVIWIVAIGVGIALQLDWRKVEVLGVVLWFVGLTTVLLANQFFFPNSKFAVVISHPLVNDFIKYFLGFLSVICLTASILAAGGFVLRLSKVKMIVLSVVLIALLGLHYLHHRKPVDAATEDRPNIILIGIDSLRPDFLGFFGHAQRTPHFDDFLNHAVVFSESLTPLARTYPSWVSILTGIYPKINGIRTNLADPSQLNFSETLPAILKAHGYKTIFSTDETRFSNIDRRYGFDEVATTPIGFNDFLLGTLNDFPLSNILVNTMVGRYLFPYSYGNRAVFTTYEPNSFLHLLQSRLAESRHQPVFLVTHLCLPHFPYGWANLLVKKVSVRHYQAAIERADKQFYDLMAMLQKNNLLEHSIVILLSDHGEAVERAGDRITDPELFITQKKDKKIPRFYPPSSAKERVNTSGGHGTDVLGLPQYHTVLAFRLFGLGVQPEKVVPGMVSLMDIKPTVLQYLKLPATGLSGTSLYNIVFGKEDSVLPRQDFFTESDFSPEAIRSVHPEERKVLFEGINYFRIDPRSTRVMVKEDMLRMIISSKQYADYYHDWVLALYPQNKDQMMPILVNLKTGYWTNDLSTPFAKRSPAQHMLVAMKHFFGGDISHISEY